MGNETRIGFIRQTGIGTDEVETGRVSAFMPSNYEVRVVNADTLIVEGHDVAGWTMKDYIIPRLASGMIYCKEVEL